MNINIDKAWDFLKFAKADKLNFSESYWDHTVQYFRNHHLLGYLYFRFKKDIPDKYLVESAKAFDSQCKDFDFYQLELDKILESYPVTTLLGIDLAKKYYTHPGQRFIEKLEVFYSGDNLKGLEEFIFKMGYKKRIVQSSIAYHVKNRYQKKIADKVYCIEIYTQLFYDEPKGLRWNTSFKGDNTLAIDEGLVHLMGHLAYQKNFFCLNSLKDIDLYIRKNHKNLNWSRVMNLVKSLKQVRSTRYVLWAANYYLNTPVPYDLLPKNQRGFISLLSTEFLWAPREDKLKHQRVKHLTKDSFISALKYDYLRLFKKY